MRTVSQIKPKINRIRKPKELKKWFRDNKETLSLPATSYVKFKLYQITPRNEQPALVESKTPTEEALEIFGGSLLGME